MSWELNQYFAEKATLDEDQITQCLTVIERSAGKSLMTFSEGELHGVAQRMRDIWEYDNNNQFTQDQSVSNYMNDMHYIIDSGKRQMELNYKQNRNIIAIIL